MMAEPNVVSGDSIKFNCVDGHVMVGPEIVKHFEPIAGLVGCGGDKTVELVTGKVYLTEDQSKIIDAKSPLDYDEFNSLADLVPAALASKYKLRDRWLVKRRPTLAIEVWMMNAICRYYEAMRKSFTPSMIDLAKSRRPVLRWERDAFSAPGEDDADFKYYESIAAAANFLGAKEVLAAVAQLAANIISCNLHKVWIKPFEDIRYSEEEEKTLLKLGELDTDQIELECAVERLTGAPLVMSREEYEDIAASLDRACVARADVTPIRDRIVKCVRTYELRMWRLL